jgi:predicted RNase H-like HicB family nuclease
MKYYYAIFTQTDEAIEVEFPDLPGCVTFGETWEEAYENAVDVLAGWLAHAEPQFIKEPSLHTDLESIRGEIVPVPIEKENMQMYKKTPLAPKLSPFPA